MYQAQFPWPITSTKHHQSHLPTSGNHQRVTAHQKPFTGGDSLTFDHFAAALLYDTQAVDCTWTVSGGTWMDLDVESSESELKDLNCKSDQISLHTRTLSPYIYTIHKYAYDMYIIIYIYIYMYTGVVLIDFKVEILHSDYHFLKLAPFCAVVLHHWTMANFGCFLRALCRFPGWVRISSLQTYHINT